MAGLHPAFRHALLRVLPLLAATVAAAATFPLPTDGSTVVGEVKLVYPSGENTLLDLARHFDLGYEEMLAANPGVSPWTPGDKTRVVVPRQFILPPPPWHGITINVAERRLYFFPDARKGRLRQVITYPVSIAREGWATPLGKTRIVAKYRNPGWLVPESIEVEHLLEEGVELPEYFPPGPDNPMGMLALRTGFPGIFIHATNRPWGVGMRTSHGCIHLYPEDAAELFPLVAPGTQVRIIDEPFLFGDDRGRLVMSSFAPAAPFADADSAEASAFQSLQEFLLRARRQGTPGLLDWSRIGRVIATPQPVPVAITRDQADLADWLGTLTAAPYTSPPYGSDANAAQVPQRPPERDTSLPPDQRQPADDQRRPEQGP